MHIHDTLQSEHFDRDDRPPPNLSAAAMVGSQLHGTMRKSRQLRCSAAISTAAAANAPKLLAGEQNLT
jgi:hypothetical protein